ncbi:Hpt domain-containing protein [Flavobacterium gillisiae]|jgi:HPt (histidine-containing phosphotransfer) domain-containing protein|uniref:Hpt domain-containing protein n=1 Tax=Flavobacterium gillisiae TaxID=150146 RepID=A0A1H4CTR8_9FLAO|nr:Hpt domain-containing protein [Flavobacterium gillisiae]SEA63704.1 Hpt domain-containing protein [Flavobacterium gillisiae]|tara:strand:+ start:18713 stop:19030 length:318 start_codon:yes stop_codon:yes gene_type:complete
METPNLNYINELSGGNEEFKIKIIGILKRELPVEVEVYQNEVDKANFLQAAQAVHKLKHKVSILGLEKSYYIASDYEDNLKDNSVALKNDFEAILKAMQEFVIQL